MQKRSEETKNRILSAALLLISKQGYDATGLSQICTEAAVSRGAFYHHFSSKHDLFIELLNAWLREMDDLLKINLQTTETVPTGLLKIAGPINRIFTDAKGQLPIFLEFWLQSYRNPELWKKTIDPYFKYRTFFERLFEKGVREGSIRNIDPQISSKLIIALSLGLLLSSMVDPDGGDWGSITQTSITYLLEGIQRS
jgi:AcrR family transcriptional regulator